MKKFSISLAAVIACANIANADILAFGAGAGVWSATPSGDANYKNAPKFDIKDDTGLSSATKPYLWAFLEHPIPVLPNVRVDYSSYESDGTKDTNIDFAGHNFTSATKTELTIKELDTTLYYTLPVPFVDLDLGFGAKNISGDLMLSSSGVSKKEDLSVTLPYGYLGAKFDIPNTSVGLSADLKYISYKKSSLSDMRFAVNYKAVDSVVKLGVEAGYRAKTVVIEDISSVDAEVDIKIAGFFGGVFARF